MKDRNSVNRRSVRLQKRVTNHVMFYQFSYSSYFQMSQDFAEMQEDDDEGGLIIDTDLIADAIQSVGEGQKGDPHSGNNHHNPHIP